MDSSLILFVFVLTVGANFHWSSRLNIIDHRITVVPYNFLFFFFFLLNKVHYYYYSLSGCGPIGLMATGIAKAMGAKKM